MASHAEGAMTQANGMASHAEGIQTIASGQSSHAEGIMTQANGTTSHAEGSETQANGFASHAEGESTTASGAKSHSEGYETVASGDSSHAEGYSTHANGDYSHAEGRGTSAMTDYSHAEGRYTTASGQSSHAEGGPYFDGFQSFDPQIANGQNSHVEGSGTETSGMASHAEGINTRANGDGSHAEGGPAQSQGSQTSYYNTIANGMYSHAEGMGTTANTDASHAEGYMTKTYGYFSHAEGEETVASGQSSHAEGYNAQANGEHSHAEGIWSQANGDGSHAEGGGTQAIGNVSHAEGNGTIANNQSEHASGQFNVSSSGSSEFGDSGNTLFSVGNGKAGNLSTPFVRHNAIEIRQNGDIYIANTNASGEYYEKPMLKLQDSVGSVNALQTQINAIQDFLKPRDYVEIGGVKLATMNIGATGITDTGLYFQWGDISGYTAAQVGGGEGQKYFGWADYKHSNDDGSVMTKYNSTDGKTVLDASDDAEKSAWFGWRMPTTAEYVALGNAVNTAWTQVNGVYGMLCTDKNDSSKTLFFPACGYCSNGKVVFVGSDGMYWSSSLYDSDVQKARQLYFEDGSVGWQDSFRRCNGFPVRGVLGE
jgi:hypothetical protein